MISFGSYFDKIEHVKDWDSFVWFWNSISPEMQIVTGIVIFGLCVLVWIFVVAIFIDKHI